MIKIGGIDANRVHRPIKQQDDLYLEVIHERELTKSQPERN
jgi:hypothetical protein